MDKRRQELLDWLNNKTQFSPPALEMVSGDASFRRYFRFIENETSYIAVDAPPEFENNEVFVAVANAYLQAGVKVPEILFADFSLGFLCIEDFGDEQFASKYEADDVEKYYRQALSDLIPIQSVQTCENVALPSFDDELLDAEFYLFNHWLLEVHLNIKLSKEELAVIQDSQDYIRHVFKSQPQAGVHRDYHSRNLMVLSSDKESPELGIIDFQDAVVGPITYDAVSLLRDCYVVWSDEFVDTLLENWRGQNFSQYSSTEFRKWFDLVGIQRHIKASGIFCRLCHRDGKKGYLNDIPRTLDYIVKIAKRYPECQEFALLVESKVLPAINKTLEKQIA